MKLLVGFLLLALLIALFLTGQHAFESPTPPPTPTRYEQPHPTTTDAPVLPSTTTAAPTTTTVTPTARTAPIAKPRVRAASATGVSDDTWDRVAQCESGQRWDDTRGGYEGGLHFMHDTWVRAGGRQFAEHAYQATRRQQIDIANSWLARTGWYQWPSCSRQLGLR